MDIPILLVPTLSSGNASQDYAFMLLVTLEYATSRIATAYKIEVGSVGDITYCKTPAGIFRGSYYLFSFILE
jgi:hypothetical protein